MEFAEENLLAMGAAFENFRRPSAVHANSRFSEGEGVFPICSDLPQFGVVRERAFVGGRLGAFEFFSLDADLFPVALNDEAWGKGLSGTEGVGEGVLEGIGGNVLQGGIPAFVEESCLGFGVRRFLPQGQECLKDQHREKAHPVGVRSI